MSTPIVQKIYHKFKATEKHLGGAEAGEFFFGTTLDLVSATKCFLHKGACADQVNYVYTHAFQVLIFHCKG